jgi:[acyl-carrier-protein] S-malonyltransferase
MAVNGIIGTAQGGQYVGMGSDLFNSDNSIIKRVAQALYERADKFFGYKISDISFNGPREDLDRTLNTQRAVYTHSEVCLAVLRELYVQRFGDEFDYHASIGASLGEIFALRAGGAMDLEGGLRLVEARSRVMEDVISSDNPSRQLVIRMYVPNIEALCSKHNVEVSNYNAHNQVVVGGSPDGVSALRTELLEIYKDTPRAESYFLDIGTAAAFHTRSMTPARMAFAQELEKFDFDGLSMPVISNHSGNSYSGKGTDIKYRLARQVDSPVLFGEGLQVMISRLLDMAYGQSVALFEFGGGKPTPAGEDPKSPEKQRGLLGGMVREAIKDMGLTPNKEVRPYDCVSERSILDTLAKLEKVRLAEENYHLGAPEFGEMKFILHVPQGYNPRAGTVPIGYDPETQRIIQRIQQGRNEDKILIRQLATTDTKTVHQLGDILGEDVRLPVLEMHILGDTPSILGAIGSEAILKRLTDSNLI